MASEQTKRLIADLSQKVSDNTENITILSSSIPETQSKIDDFTPACSGIDLTILNIINNINSLKSQILAIGSTAQNIVGCGSTGLEIVNQDAEYLYSWNASGSSYNGDDPYGSVTNQILSSSNIGIGTFNQLSNNGGTNIGTYYALSGPGYATSTNGEPYVDMLPIPIVESAQDTQNCQACQAAIASLNSQISSLRSTIVGPTNTVNTLKFERLEYEVKRYGYRNAIKLLEDENVRVGSALTILTSPSYDSIV